MNNTIQPKQVREWVKQYREGKFKMLMSGSKVVMGRGRKAAFPKLEAKLHEWVVGLREQGKGVSKLQILHKALHMSHEKEFRNLHPALVDFKGSSGWLSKYVLMF